MEFVHKRGVHRITSNTVNLIRLPIMVSVANRYRGARMRVLNYPTVNFILTEILCIAGVTYGEFLVRFYFFEVSTHTTHTI